MSWLYLRSEEAGAALNAAATGINGAEVNVHVGKLTDVREDADILKGSDVLILDVDPRDEKEVQHLQRHCHINRAGRKVR